MSGCILGDGKEQCLSMRYLWLWSLNCNGILKVTKVLLKCWADTG